MTAKVFVWESLLAEHTLLLGGTGLAKQLAHRLLEQGHRLTYSVAGLVRRPDLNCQVISGGFSQFGGMAHYLRTEGISHVLDATHPYAAQISRNALEATEQCRIPYGRLQRPAWLQTEGDHWLNFADWEQLLPALQHHQHIFLSQGRLSTKQLQQLTDTRQTGQQFYLRTAIAPGIDLPDWIKSLTAIGPFAYQDELDLFQRLNINLLVSKNSGGDMTYGKIQAARQLEIPVLMLERPPLPEAIPVFYRIDDVLNSLSHPKNDN